MGVLSRPEIDPEAFSEALVRFVVPSVLNGDVPAHELGAVAERRLGEARKLSAAYAGNTPSEHRRALMDAAEALVPPASLASRDDTYSVLLGMIAFRAASGDLLYQYSVYERYERAASWVCENFRPLIWWNCD